MTNYGDLTGRVFGDLTVLWEANRGKNGGSSWLCRCACGHIDVFEGNRLANGHNTHCRYCSYGRFEFFDNYKRVRCILPKGKYFTFDYADFPLVSRCKWRIDAQGYPKTATDLCGSKDLHLHTLLMNPPKPLIVDHIDGNKLNNCRDNLRICTRVQNSQNMARHKNNTSGYKGVSFNKARNKWDAYITVYGKRRNLGRFKTDLEAALAYDKAASFYFGEFAKLNLTEGGPV